MSATRSNRILAVEIRAARLGYAVFEVPRRLRDFGAHLFASPYAARGRISRLLRMYSPSVLVLHGAGPRYPRDMRSRKGIARIARGEAKKLSIPFTSIPERTFRSFFGRYSCRDKYDIAIVLAKWFPELTWRLPPMLDFYDPEPRAMLYFDSIALGIAYLELTKKNEQKDSEDQILSPASR